MEKINIKNLKEDHLKIIKIDRLEFDNIKSRRLDDPVLLDWMSKKGIRFGKQPIEIEIDGERYRMITEKIDFGTLIQE
ncbi:MAG: hypothetical protein Q8Q06_03575 [bacterium]|nr:hypothetical protein [bacterium]